MAGRRAHLGACELARGVCGQCGNELEIKWDCQGLGGEAYCPVCAARMVLREKGS